jgi:hypothetical protein
MAHQTQHRPHPELSNGVAWMPVSLQSTPPPPPPAPTIPPIVYPVAGVLLVVLGYSIALGHRDWQLLQAQQRAAQSQAQLQQVRQAKEAYCKSP